MAKKPDVPPTPRGLTPPTELVSHVDDPPDQSDDDLVTVELDDELSELSPAELARRIIREVGIEYEPRFRTPKRRVR
jgi:hypothetical protein